MASQQIEGCFVSATALAWLPTNERGRLNLVAPVARPGAAGMQHAPWGLEHVDDRDTALSDADTDYAVEVAHIQGLALLRGAAVGEQLAQGRDVLRILR